MHLPLPGLVDGLLLRKERGPVLERDQLLPAYRAIERRVEREIFRRLALPEKPAPQVKHADLVALATEKRDLLPAGGREWAVLRGIEPLPEALVPLRPQEARDLFLARVVELGGEKLWERWPRPHAWTRRRPGGEGALTGA